MNFFFCNMDTLIPKLMEKISCMKIFFIFPYTSFDFSVIQIRTYPLIFPCTGFYFLVVLTR